VCKNCIFSVFIYRNMGKIRLKEQNRTQFLIWFKTCCLLSTNLTIKVHSYTGWFLIIVRVFVAYDIQNGTKIKQLTVYLLPDISAASTTLPNKTFWITLSYSACNLFSRFRFENSLLFYIRVTFIAYLFILVRGMLPRFRYEKLMYLAWKSFFPFIFKLSFIFLGIELFILSFL
jgi:hypothetical protein